MPKTLILLLLAASGSALAAPPAAPPLAPELFLAGGALRTCSDLAPRACRTPPAGETLRTPPLFRVDSAGISRALDPLLWSADTGAPSRKELAAMLRSVRREAAWGRDAIKDALDAHCPRRKCAQSDDRPWRRLLDDERATLLSALEVPQLRDGVRSKERAHLADSVEPAGVAVLRAFVASAARRSGGARPRIAVVTASGVDPFDAVDFYLDAFRELGADASWWPVDAALKAAVFEEGRCDALESLRREKLGLANRDRVFPDLAQLQAQACRDAAATAELPRAVQGIFFAGGDQWRHRQAFFDRNDQPNAWLISLREAHASGQLVVGGTSAGTAVQGGGAMVSNGDSAQALKTGALARLPMAPGCERARRCAQSLPESSLTYWAAGGLGLLPGWTVDTHFSERARELRLLVLMHAAKVDFAMGVDETTAVHVVQRGDETSFEAIGARGAWLFERQPAQADGALEARAHYLVPGAVVTMTAEGMRPLSPLHAPGVVLTLGPTPTDALIDGSLRAATRALSGCPDKQAPTTLAADAGRVTLSCLPLTQSWTDDAGSFVANGNIGIINFQLHYQPGNTAP